MNVKRFVVMTDDGRNFAIYGRSRIERDTASGAWKRRWAVLRRRCVDILIDTGFADLPFVRCEPKFLCCLRLRNTIDANAELLEGDPELKCWFIDKPYTNV